MNVVKVRDLMVRNIIFVSPEETIVTVSRLMMENVIGSILVCESLDDLNIGIITLRDIVSRVVIECSNPCEIKARDVATKNLITISSEENIKAAFLLMLKHKIKRLPVRNPESNKLVGIISSYDIIAAFNSLNLE
ncbi:CBS domain-containing protein [Candidatus Hodarchaeum mangrovi]